MPLRCFFALMVLVCVPHFGAATTLRVPAQHANIQAALTSAAVGDTVLVAAGTYTGTGNRNLDFKGKDLVLLAESGSAVTIIDVAGSEQDPARGILLGSALTQATVVDGFTIVNGFMAEMSEPSLARSADARHDLSGAGIMIRGFCSPIVRNCIIRNCSSAFTGGGLGIELGAAPRLENVVVRGCSAGIQGGGLSLETGADATLINCIFIGNRALNGGGAHFSPGAVTVIGSVFAGNSADGRGGGIDALLFSRVRLEQTIVWNNCGSQGDDFFVDPAIADEPSDFVQLVCCIVDTTGVHDEGGALEYVADNVFADPAFCSPADCQEAPTLAGDYAVGDASPARVENSPCGVAIGAGNGGCASPVRADSWTKVKSRYRR